MFIRLTTKKDKLTNKIYSNYQLVESYRTPKGPRQRILLTIGSQLNLDKKERKILSNRIEEILANIQTFFPCEPKIEKLAHEFVAKILEKKAVSNQEKKQKEELDRKTKKIEESHNRHVDLNSLRTYQARTIGTEYILHEAIKMLNLDKCFSDLGMKEQDCKLAIASIIDQLSSKEQYNPIIVMDAGLASKKNLLWLKENQYPYITVVRRKSKQLIDAEELSEWKTVKKTADNEVTAVWKKSENSDERCLCCISTARARKEKKAQNKKQETFEKELTSLKEGLFKSRCLKDSQLVEQKIGKFKEKHKKIARFYEIAVKHCEKTGNAQNLSWKVDQEKINNDFGGSYYLRTSVQNVSEEKLWRLYTMLSQVESAFEEMKSTLGLRPVYHQLEHRIDGHMWITLLAYHLTHTIRYQLQVHGIDLSWKSIRDIMNTQVRVSTKVNQTNGKTCHIRTTTEAEPMQKKILQALGLPFKALKRLIVEY